MTEQADKEMLKVQQDLENKTLKRIERLEDRIEKLESEIKKLRNWTGSYIVSEGGHSER